jgi:hypothetical protein
MIEIDTAHDFWELLRPLLQDGPVRIIAGTSMFDLAASDLTALLEPALTLIANTIDAGGRLRIVSGSFPPITLAGRSRRISG